MPLNKTVTYAQILESQGFKQEALDIYAILLEKHPDDIEIKESIDRLEKKRKHFQGVNQKRKDHFIHMESDEAFEEFEKWLGAL